MPENTTTLLDAKRQSISWSGSFFDWHMIQHRYFENQNKLCNQERERRILFEKTHLDHFIKCANSCFRELELTWQKFLEPYPKYPSVYTVPISAAHMLRWVDLSPFVNSAPHMVHDDAPLVHCYRIFRSLGMRHLYVVGSLCVFLYMDVQVITEFRSMACQKFGELSTLGIFSPSKIDFDSGLKLDKTHVTSQLPI